MKAVGAFVLGIAGWRKILKALCHQRPQVAVWSKVTREKGPARWLELGDQEGVITNYCAIKDLCIFLVLTVPTT
jgi:hypothetical protein